MVVGSTENGGFLLDLLILTIILCYGDGKEHYHYTLVVTGKCLYK